MASFFDTIRQKWRGGQEPLVRSGIYDDSEDGLEIPNNPSGREFLDSAKANIRKTIEKYSITHNAIRLGNERGGLHGGGGAMNPSSPFGASGVFNPASDVDVSFESSTLGLAVPVDTNKISRLQSYDNISRYPELDWCINEIANDFIHEDIEGDFIKLKFKCDTGKYANGTDKVIEEEFRHLMSNFDLRANGYNMMRKFLIEGEICFENVIDSRHPEYGIIGAKYIPNAFYDFLRDQKTGQVCGLYIDPEKMKTYMQFGAYGGGASSYGGQSSTMFNAVRSIPSYTYTYSQDMRNKIVFPWEQVTYANSGVLSEDGSIVFPHIEKVVVPIRQLLLMHDAMVIMRVTRAPEKLMFNIDMTGLQPREAKNYVRKFAEQRKSKKALQGSGTLTNVYNSETMLDAYYFWKTSESGGTSVSSLNSTAHYNELHDVEYFLRRVLKFLNIPWSRWAESQANRQDKNSIQNEEFSFAKMIVRFQQMFSSAVKKTFITHLRLRELFDKFDMNESDFDVVMNPPSLFENYQAEQRFTDFLNVMNSMASLEFLSKNVTLKKIFGWTEGDIRDNEVNARREKLFSAQTDYMAQQIAAQGTPTAGKVWLDPEKYLNPPVQNPSGTDVNGQGAMPPPQDGGAPIPPQDGGASVPPTDGGAPMPPPQDMGSQPPAEGAMPTPPPPQTASVAMDIPEPEIPPDDSGTTKSEKELPVNPEFGEYEKRSRQKNIDMANHYPETENELIDLETGRNTPLKDIFDKTLGAERDEDKRMADIYSEEFGKSGKKYEGELTGIFKDEFGTEEGEGNGEKSLSDIFDDAFGKRNAPKKREKLGLLDTFRDVFIRKTAK